MCYASHGIRRRVIDGRLDFVADFVGVYVGPELDFVVVIHDESGERRNCGLCDPAIPPLPPSCPGQRKTKRVGLEYCIQTQASGPFIPTAPWRRKGELHNMLLYVRKV